MLNNSMLLCVLVVAGSAGFAGEQTFVFGKHGEKHNLITIESSTELETIVTTSNTTEGEMKWDVEAKAGSAKLSVPVASLSTGIKVRDGHLQSAGFLDGARFPNITFETTSVKARDDGSYDVAGNFTMHGVTHPVSAVAKVKYIAYKPEFEKAHMPKGNYAKITAIFDLKLSDFKITPPSVPANVSDDIKVKIALTGVNEI